VGTVRVRRGRLGAARCEWIGRVWRGIVGLARRGRTGEVGTRLGAGQTVGTGREWQEWTGFNGEARQGRERQVWRGTD